jgi:hypothetical protein
MVNMANPFGASDHYQPPFQFNPGASTSSELAAGNPAVFHFHPGEMRDQHSAPAYQPERFWPGRHQTPAHQPEHGWPNGHQTPGNQHGSMDLGAIFHATASYNP